MIEVITFRKSMFLNIIQDVDSFHERLQLGINKVYLKINLKRTRIFKRKIFYKVTFGGSAFISSMLPLPFNFLKFALRVTLKNRVKKKMLQKKAVRRTTHLELERLRSKVQIQHLLGQVNQSKLPKWPHL